MGVNGLYRYQGRWYSDENESHQAYFLMKTEGREYVLYRTASKRYRKQWRIERRDTGNDWTRHPQTGSEWTLFYSCKDLDKLPLGEWTKESPRDKGIAPYPTVVKDFEQHVESPIAT